MILPNLDELLHIRQSALWGIEAGWVAELLRESAARKPLLWFSPRAPSGLVSSN